MSAPRREESAATLEARHMLGESVTRLRRNEKAAAIKKKREEVEALRRALASHAEASTSPNVAPISGEKSEMLAEMRRKQGVVDEALVTMRRNTPTESVGEKNHSGDTVVHETFPDLNLERGENLHTNGRDCAEGIDTGGPPDEHRETPAVNVSDSMPAHGHSESEIDTSTAAENVAATEDFTGDYKLQVRREGRRPDEDGATRSNTTNPNPFTPLSPPRVPPKMVRSTEHDSGALVENSNLGDRHVEKLSMKQQSPITARRDKLWPPTADVSPVRHPRVQKKGEATHWFDEDYRAGPERRVEMDIASSSVNKTGESFAVPDVGNDKHGMTQDLSGKSQSHSKENSRNHVQGWKSAESADEERVSPATGTVTEYTDEARTNDDPLRRALTRSVQGEGLAEYSIRAYNVYRAHGVILDGEVDNALYNCSVQPGGSQDIDLAMSAPPVSATAGAQSPAMVEGTPTRSTHGRYDEPKGYPRRANGYLGGVSSDPVRPFSPPSPRANDGTYEKPIAAGPELTLNTQRNQLGCPVPLKPEEDLTVCDLSEGDRSPPGVANALRPPLFRSRIQAPRSGRAIAMATSAARRDKVAEKRSDPSQRCELQGHHATNKSEKRKVTLRVGQHTSSTNNNEQHMESSQIRVDSSGTALPPPPPPTVNAVGHDRNNEHCRDAERDHRDRNRRQLVEAWQGEESDSNSIDRAEDVHIPRSLAAASELIPGDYSKPVGMSQGSAESNGTSSAAYACRATCSNVIDDGYSQRFASGGSDHEPVLLTTPCIEKSRKFGPGEADKDNYWEIDDSRLVEQAKQGCAATKNMPQAVPRPDGSSHLNSAVSPVSHTRRSGLDANPASGAEGDNLCNGESNTISRKQESLYTKECAETAKDNEDPSTTDSAMNRRVQGRLSSATEKQHHDGEGFVWFGQPDTPGMQSDEERGGMVGRHAQRNEQLAIREPVTAKVSPLHTVSSPLRTHQAEAKILLQMEVRRQRDIIDRASRAREEEGRARRARVGAEVFKIMKMSRFAGREDGRANVAHGQAQLDSPPKSPQENQSKRGRGNAGLEGVCSLNHAKPEVNGRCPQASEEAPDETRRNGPFGSKTDTADQVAPSERGGAMVARSGGNEMMVSHLVTLQKVRTRAPAASSSPYGGTATRNGVVQELEKSMQSSPQQESDSGLIQNLKTEEGLPLKASENSWRKIGTVYGSGSPLTVRAPTPPAISFDVAADELKGGRGGGLAEDRDQARRRERFEALRNRKLLEAELCRERRQAQRARQGTARQALAHAVASAVIPDTDRRVHPTTAADEPCNASALHPQDRVEGSSMRGESIQQGVPTGNPRPPACPPLCSRGNASPSDGVGGASDGIGGEGGRVGGDRVVTPGSGKRNSAVVRGFSRRSNRKLVRNAINFLCLAGGHLKEQKARVLEATSGFPGQSVVEMVHASMALDSNPASNFVLLLAHTKLLTFKGLYSCDDGDHAAAERVFGLGPLHLDASTVSGFYKYNSAAREFREVHSKTLGKTTDAVSVEPRRLRRSKGSAAQPIP